MSRVAAAMRRAREAGDSGPRAEGLAGDLAASVSLLETMRDRWESTSEGEPDESPAPEQEGESSRSASAGGEPTAESPLSWAPAAALDKLVISPHVAPAVREQYRRVAAELHQTQLEHGIRVVMITSTLPGEGKTLTAANLALTFSESYDRKVLLIDSDLRQPTMHKLFNVSNRSGLTDGLMAAHQPLAVVRARPRLSLLPAGQPLAAPMAALTSAAMRELIDEARTVFDWVVLDTPPVGLLPDANLLASMVDGAVLVVAAGRTPYTAVQRTIETIGRERVFGAVLNRAETDALEGAYERYGYAGQA